MSGTGEPLLSPSKARALPARSSGVTTLLSPLSTTGAPARSE